MRANSTIRTRAFSLLIPMSVDGMLGLVQTSIPLLAMRLGADALFLGLLGATPQMIRFPICLASGRLSDRVGRMKVLLPAAGMAFLACIALALAGSRVQVLIMNVLLMSAIGAFYPVFQAFLGDRSPRGELRKNLSVFNIGWTVGGALCASTAGYLFATSKTLPFFIGAGLTVLAIGLILVWSRTRGAGAESRISEAAVVPDEGPGPLLLISRVTHFTSFFGYGIVRNLFPKLGLELHMSEGTIGLMTGMMFIGQAIGMFALGAGPWWRGRLWPQLAAQGAMFAVGLTAYLSESTLVFAAAFFVQGLSMGVAYTTALYYGLQARTNMGRNTGIHESLVAASIISGSFIGGLLGQVVSLRAPYAAFCLVSLVALTITPMYLRWSAHRAFVTSTATSSENSPPV